MTAALHVLSGGAAQGLVAALEAQVRQRHPAGVAGTFGAVGAMRDQLLAGAPCDVLILSQALIDDLQAQGHVRPGSAKAVGRVRTGVAVKAGRPHPKVDTADDLRSVLAAAPGIYFPDPQKATAGIHFMKVLKALELAEPLAGRLRTYPNGAAAMRELAAAAEPDAVGCTQFTEILYTPGVELVGALPPQFELATMYTAAVCTRAAQPEAAQALVDLLASDAAAEVRRHGGFV